MRRGIGTLAVLMVGLSLPAFAQQKETTTTEMRHEVEAVTMKWMDALNSGNIANAEAMFAANAIAVDPYGVQNGPREIAENMRKVHDRGLHITLEVKDVEQLFGGRTAVASGPYTASYSSDPQAQTIKGNWLQVMEHDGTAWKIRISTATRLATPAPATGSTTPPASGTTR